MTFARRRATELVTSLSLLLVVACAGDAPAPDSNKATAASVSRARFGVAPDGKEVGVYTLTNAHGIEVRALDYGGIITVVRAPDRSGKLDDVVLGFDDMKGYVASSPYFGAIVGRYGNRIARGRFTLDGKTYTLATNNAPNHLHGGVKGFDKVVWKGEEFRSDSGAGVVLSYVSAD